MFLNICGLIKYFRLTNYFKGGKTRQSTLADKLQIVVVDNASTDGSREELKQNWEADKKDTIWCAGGDFTRLSVRLSNEG